MIPGSLAALCSAAGLTLLYLSWRDTWPDGGRLKHAAVPGGWALQLVAAALWVLASGIEFGLTFALLFPTLSAWVLILLNHEMRASSHGTAPARAVTIPDAGTLGRQGLRLLAAVPLAGAAAALVSVALTAMMPAPQASQLATGILVMPLAWGAGAAWVCMDPRPARPVLVLAAALVVSALFLFV